MAAKPIQIAIVVNGGIVQEVISPVPVEYVTLDTDREAVDRVAIVPRGSVYFGDDADEREVCAPLRLQPANVNRRWLRALWKIAWAGHEVV